jgi:hypothetical protein
MSSALDFFADFNSATGGSCSSTGVLESKLTSGFLGAGRGRGRAACDVVADSDRVGESFTTPWVAPLNDRLMNIVAQKTSGMRRMAILHEVYSTWKYLDIINGQ